MRSSLKTWLAEVCGEVFRRCGGDTTELTRQAYRLLTKDQPEGEPADIDRMEFLKRMSTLADSAELKWLSAMIVREQATLTYENARHLDDLNLARGTANGLLLLEQRLNAYKNELDDLRRLEGFDKHAVI